MNLLKSCFKLFPVVMAGVLVDIYCKHRNQDPALIRGALTQEGGVFYEEYSRNEEYQCIHGDVAWFEVTYNEVLTRSENVTVQLVIISGDQNYDYASFGGVAAGVPEFSTVTLGLAVMGTIFGLNFLRKKKK